MKSKTRAEAKSGLDGRPPLGERLVQAAKEAAAFARGEDAAGAIVHHRAKERATSEEPNK